MEVSARAGYARSTEMLRSAATWSLLAIAQSNKNLATRAMRISRAAPPFRAREVALRSRRPILAELAGMTARAIARELNERKVPLPGRGPWHAMTVIRVQRRLKGAR